MRLSRPVREHSAPKLPVGLIRAVVMLSPALLLAIAGMRATETARLWLLGGVGGAFLIAAALYRIGDPRPWHNVLTIVPFAAAFAWQWFSKADMGDPVQKIVQAVLVLSGVALFSVQTIVAGGGPVLRRAQYWSRRLSRRSSWPEQLDDCRGVPEVEPLRDALISDAAPALPLLQHSNPQVQIAALAAIEFRKSWNLGQQEQVLHLAQSSPSPEIRAAAALALGNCQNRVLIESLAEMLRDPSPKVRMAAIEAVLWDTEHRWIWVRHAVHDALADPRFGKDGPLTLSRGVFAAPALADLVAWSAESGVLGTRATQTLGQHYKNQILANPSAKLVQQLRDLVANARATTIMRIELANILIDQGLMPEELLQTMLNPANPSPLRLLAVESLLQSNQQEQAIDVLREVARQPNRELALTAAALVQKYLHVDLGLALGASMPPIHSRQAADVTRRIMDWANHSFVASPASVNAAGEW